MGYELPVRKSGQTVELTNTGIRGLIRGEIVPWEALTKIEADEDAVTFYVKEGKPYVVPVARDNELQLLNLRAIIEKYFIGNDIAKYDRKTETWQPMPEFDFSKLEEYELQAQPAAPGVRL